MLELLIIIIICFLIVYQSTFYLERFINNIETIFVNIPSYRDTDCRNTLKSLYDNAKYPELIYAGVFQQVSAEHSEELCPVDFRYRNNVRYKTVDYTEAKGPLYARMVINRELYRGEKYYLMIDSHTLFLENWDVRMKKQLSYLRSQGIEKPIISSYPHHIDLNKNITITNKKRNVTTLICDIINATDYPTEALALEKPSGVFYKSLLLGAGYLFTYGEFFKEINLDLDLKHIFSGEEILIAILAYTHGWDIFSPAYMNLFHYYNHKKPNWHKDLVIKKKDTKRDETISYQKLKQMLSSSYNTNEFGQVRDINDFWKELGFNKKGKTLQDKFPSSSKVLRCDNTPVIIYPHIETFISY